MKKMYALVCGAALLFAAGVPLYADAVTNLPAEGQKPLYVCPMHPSVTSDKPGKCPSCGMPLVPAPVPNDGKSASAKSNCCN